MNKFLSVLKGAAAVVLHFAHGGLLAVGLMVSAFVVLRVAEAGLTPRMLPSLPEFSLLGAVSAPAADGADEVQPVSASTATTLSSLQKNVADHVSRRHRVAKVAVEQYVTDIYAAANRYKIDPLLMVALISVESAFNPTAESAWGAQGLTQVIPKYHPEKLAQFGPEATLLDPTTSIFVGAQVLREYIRATGSVEGGLQRYVGSIEDPDQIYSNKVMAEYRRLASVFGPRTQTASVAF